ncbi:hypothetical protein QJS10_CPA06g00333 [Acorus calamus]|uniref:Glycosyl transferase CAP10 domain-containing protein n=1 Tax=Acorus calamus TaxID=4465 RepID=A0AAV9ENH3_ACOCL|nr:hypothetical protein QJS10_CPA06g00333 [Acorus calamus]
MGLRSGAEAQQHPAHEVNHPEPVVTVVLLVNHNTSSTQEPIHTAQTVIPPITCSSSGKPTPHQSACPDYFRWIHEDLKPWKSTGITRHMVDRLARRTDNFRLVILDGRAYVEKLKDSFQSRDVFTLWGVLQLLRRYPGRVPDLELMFDTFDWPVVKSKDYRRRSGKARRRRGGPPPLFRYCGDESTLDIVFPDWSFWGWPEINIKPWEVLKEELREGNERVNWLERVPYAYWKGNPVVAVTRQELLQCNVSKERDWNARIYAQAQDIGKAASSFIQEELKMDHVYDYILHLLTEYAKLQKFKPRKPRKAIEISVESMACHAEGLEKKFMMESMVNVSRDMGPCELPPPYDQVQLNSLLKRKANFIKQIENWEQRAWDKQMS